MLSWYEPVRLHFLPTHIVLFYSFLMPWVRISFFLLSAAAGELFYLSLAVLLGREARPAAPCWHWGSPTVWGGWEWQQQEVLWAADPVWAGTKSHRSGSADTKWGQTAHCCCWNDCSAGGAGKLLQIGFKREWAPYCCGKERVPCCPRLPLKGPTSAGRGSDPGTFPSCG